MGKATYKIDLKQQIEEGKFEFSSNYVCSYCKRSMDPPGTPSLTEATRDHPHPKAKGGGGLTVWSCYTCNHLKGDMDYIAWKTLTTHNPRWWTRQLRRDGVLLTQPGVPVNEQEEEKILPFRRTPMFKPELITGGQPPSTGNWLLDLPVGAKFTVRSKSDPKNFMCLDLELVNKTSRTAFLYQLATGEPFAGTGRVDANRFINSFEKVEFLPSFDEMLPPIQEETKMENKDDGASDRTVKSDA